jgi:hypothetical protein
MITDEKNSAVQQTWLYGPIVELRDCMIILFWYLLCRMYDLLSTYPVSQFIVSVRCSMVNELSVDFKQYNDGFHVT